jgi:hypothetical protein
MIYKAFPYHRKGRLATGGMFYVKKSLVKEIFESTLSFKLFLIEWSPEEE